MMRKNIALLLPFICIAALTSCKKSDTSTGTNNNSSTNNNNNTTGPTYYFKAKLNGTAWEATPIFVSASKDNGTLLHLVGGQTSSTVYSCQISIGKYTGPATYKAKEVGIGFTRPNLYDGFQTRSDDSVSVVKIISDDGKTVTGTFSGVLFNQDTNKTDSMVVTDGSFAASMI